MKLLYLQTFHYATLDEQNHFVPLTVLYCIRVLSVERATIFIVLFDLAYVLRCLQSRLFPFIRFS